MFANSGKWKTTDQTSLVNADAFARKYKSQKSNLFLKSFILYAPMLREYTETYIKLSHALA